MSDFEPCILWRNCSIFPSPKGLWPWGASRQCHHEEEIHIIACCIWTYINFLNFWDITGTYYEQSSPVCKFCVFISMLGPLRLSKGWIWLKPIVSYLLNYLVSFASIARQLLQAKHGTFICQTCWTIPSIIKAWCYIFHDCFVKWFCHAWGSITIITWFNIMSLHDCFLKWLCRGDVLQ